MKHTSFDKYYKFLGSEADLERKRKQLRLRTYVCCGLTMAAVMYLSIDITSIWSAFACWFFSTLAYVFFAREKQLATADDVVIVSKTLHLCREHVEL